MSSWNKEPINMMSSNISTNASASTPPVAIVTGVTGQDGAYLTELLLAKGYRVIGTYRRTSSVNFWRLDELGVTQHPNLSLVEFDLTDLGSSIRLIQMSGASEVYNLAAQSFVGVSFDQPITTAEITGVGAVNLLEAIRIVNPRIRFYQASTSEMFGKVQAVPQLESTPFYPRSPYGVAKLYAYWITVNYREAYGIHASNGILFNHESPIRGETFVTRKITRAVAGIHLGVQKELYIGNLDSRRDWGHARDYVEGMWRIVQQDTPDDFVLATGEAHSVREFVELAFLKVGRRLEWSGKGVDETGIDAECGETLVRVDKRYFRPAEVDLLIGDASKAHRILGWKHTVGFSDLVAEMMTSDLDAIARESHLKKVEYGGV